MWDYGCFCNSPIRKWLPISQKHSFTCKSRLSTPSKPRVFCIGGLMHCVTLLHLRVNCSPSAQTAIMILSNTNAALTATAQGWTQWVEVWKHSACYLTPKHARTHTHRKAHYKRCDAQTWCSRALNGCSIFFFLGYLLLHDKQHCNSAHTVPEHTLQQ